MGDGQFHGNQYTGSLGGASGSGEGFRPTDMISGPVADSSARETAAGEPKTGSGTMHGSTAESILTSVKDADLKVYAPDLRKEIGNDAKVKPEGYVYDKKTGDWWVKGNIDTGWSGSAGKMRVEQVADHIRGKVIEAGGKEDDVRVGPFRHGGGEGTSANIHNGSSIAIRVAPLSSEDIASKTVSREGRLRGERASSLPLTDKTAAARAWEK